MNNSPSRFHLTGPSCKLLKRFGSHDEQDRLTLTTKRERANTHQVDPLHQ